jgi:hypothetical protein
MVLPFVRNILTLTSIRSLINIFLFEKPETNRKFDNLFKETDKTSVMNTVEYLKMEGKEEAATMSPWSS